MVQELADDGTIVMRHEGDGPVDTSGFREAAAGALGANQDAGMRIEVPGGGRLDAATLAVIVQCWLTLAEREKDLIVVPTDDADRAILAGLGFDEYYRVAEAA